MRSGLAVGGAYGGAVSSTTPAGRSLVVSAAPAPAAASRIERLRRHRENIRRCARELGVDLQASRSAASAAHADQEELAVVGSATGLHRGARRVASRAHTSLAARDAMEPFGADHSVGNANAHREASVRTSTEVARTRLRPPVASEAVADEPVMSSPSRAMTSSEAQPARAIAADFGRQRLDPPSMLDDIYEVHDVLMQNSLAHAEESLRSAASAGEERAGRSEDEQVLVSFLRRPEPDLHSDDFATGSLSHSPFATHEISQAFGGAENLLLAPFTTQASEPAASVPQTSSHPVVGLPVADARTSPDLRSKSHRSPSASPAGDSNWADTSASAEDSRWQEEHLAEDSKCLDEQINGLAISRSESQSVGLPPAVSPKARAPEPTPTDFTFAGILERWRQQHSEFQHAVNHVSASPAGQVKLPARFDASIDEPNSPPTGGLADDDPECVLQRIKRDLGLETSPLAHEMETVGSKDFGLLLSETSSAHSDSVLERLQNDIHELDQSREPSTPLQAGSPSLNKSEDSGASAADGGSSNNLSKFHLGLLDGFENFAKDSLDRFTEHLREGPAATTQDAKPTDVDPGGPSEAVLARLQALEAEFMELRKKHTTGGAHAESPPPSPQRPEEEQAAPSGEAAEQLRSSLATLLSSTASSIFGARSEIPSACLPATGLDPCAESPTERQGEAPEVGFSSPGAEAAPAPLSTPTAGEAEAVFNMVAVPPLPFEAKETEEVLQSSPLPPTGVLAEKGSASEQVTPESSPLPQAALIADTGSGSGENVVRRFDVAAGASVEFGELPQVAVAGTPLAAGRGADAVFEMSELQSSPHFGLGISMMDKLFAEVKLATAATQTSSTQTSPPRAPPELMGGMKRPPALAAAGSAQVWDGSGDAYFPADRWHPGFPPSDASATSGYRAPPARPHDFAPPAHHLGILAGSSGGVRPNMRYPLINGVTPPISPRAGHAGGWPYGLPSHPSQRSGACEQRMMAATAGLPGHPERRQVPAAMPMEGASAVGSREDDQLLLRAYEVYRQQQLELLRPA